jgi:tRNA U34 5-carboxymethylaminomethyl modifying GTPase MnmE/TrmE
MSERDFLKFKEKNIIELLEQLEAQVNFGEENIEYLVQNNPDLNRLAGARDALEEAKNEFEIAKRELKEVRDELAK